MYNASVTSEFRVRQCFFRNLFNTKYNIGFGTPATDVCSTCLCLRENIKRADNQKQKVEKMTQLCVHKLRAKRFFDILRDESPNVVTFSYDCQKNMPLPKIPDQATYYSRQFYVYNFTMVQGSSKCKLTKNNVFSYTWSELDRPKGSCEVASAVYHRLKSTNFGPGTDTVRLVSDGCGGQNKHSILLMMCQKWLAHAPSNIKTVELVFPVTGHSFLPPDRVFGLIEKSVRRKTTILQPSEYFEAFGQYATVVDISDFPVLDWKTEKTRNLKDLSKWHFQISKCSRIIITRENLQRGYKIVVQGEQFYKSITGRALSLLKKNRTMANVNPSILPLGVKIKETKLHDVNGLLKKHFGSEWQQQEDLSFYSNAINNQNGRAQEQDDNHDLVCEHHETIDDLRV